MRNAIFPTAVLALLPFTGCVHEKSFDVTGVVPPSEIRAEVAARNRAEPAVIRAPRRDFLPDAAPKVERTPKQKVMPFPEPPANPPDRQVTLTPETGLVGKVASVNASLHFVVLNFPAGRMAAVEKQLALYRQGQKIGEVKVTGPQQDDNIIADVISGEAEAGDEVREK